MSEKIVKIQEVANETFKKFERANGSGATFLLALKLLGRGIAAKVFSPFKYNWIRLVGTKKTERYFVDKDILEYEEKRRGGKLSYVQTCKLGSKYPESIYCTQSNIDKTFGKYFNSLAGHKAVKATLADATDYSRDPNVVEVHYKRPTGLFGKKGGYGN